MSDYYKTLDVEKGASASEVKKAFYKKAQKYHPDKPDGDEAKFKEVNEAYQVLSDDKKRAQYDRFGSAGGPGMGGTGGGFPGGGFEFNFGQGGGGAGGFDLNDLFSAFNGGGFGGQQRAPRGRDVEVQHEITFKESIFGTEATISVPLYESGEKKGDEDITITIPAGIESGQKLRVTGRGEKVKDGQPGNLFVYLGVKPDLFMRRKGMHLIMELPVKLTDAILGAKLQVSVFDETVSIKIPAGLKPNEVMRVKGRGVMGRGDLLLQTQIQIPKKLSKKAKKAIEELQKEGI